MTEAIDTSELVKLSASFSVASARVAPEARAVVSKGAANIKTETRENISTDLHWRSLARTVNYDMEGNAFYSSATIGYDDPGVKKDPMSQGALAGIYEFGSARHAPHPTLIPAFNAEAPRFEKAMSDLAAKVIGDAL